MANLDASAKGQLGVHAPIAVGTAGLEVDLADEISEHHVPNAALGRWPLSVFVEPGLGYTQDPAGDLYGTPFRGDHFDRRGRPPLLSGDKLLGVLADGVLAERASTRRVRTTVP